jgi:hypothetical protein
MHTQHSSIAAAAAHGTAGAATAEAAAARMKQTNSIILRPYFR